VHSVSPLTITRLGLLAVCCLLLAGAASGCTTTQDTAAQKQIESKRFLREREKKRALKRKQKADGPRSEK
jgi:hypothetical protein